MAGQSHLYNVHLEDQSMEDHLSIHIILGVNEYAQIRTGAPLRVGRRGEPVAELICFGWAIMAPAVETDLSAGFLAVDAIQDFEMLCSLGVLGLANSLAGDQQEVYGGFRERLSRNTEEGWYETGLPWKEDHRHLPSNHEGSLRRLRTQVEPVRREYYMPHRAVIKDSAETTKLCVV